MALLPGRALYLAAGGLVLCAALTACTEEAPPAAGFINSAPNPCEERLDGWYCAGDEAFRCEEGSRAERDNCAAQDLSCTAGLGCLACRPSTFSCDGADRTQCRPDGSGYDVLETCPDGLSCAGAACMDLCLKAEEERSYIGCEYWPVTTRNGQLNRVFSPALVVANPQLVDATVELSRAGAVQETTRVAPGEVATIELPFVEELRGTSLVEGIEPLRSTRIAGGAYRLTSDVPVTVHQYNPLEFAADEPCAEPTNQTGDRCFSHTNDASLLLPTHVMTGDYVSVARGTFMETSDGVEVNHSPGFVTIVGVREEPVEVQVTSTAFTAESFDGTVPAMMPGDTTSFTLAQGEVVQLLSVGPETCTGESRQEQFVGGSSIEYCKLGKEYDLTGTQVRATGPVQVVAGHDCTFVPFDEWACDHLEESMFPVEAWGREVALTLPNAVAGRYWARVVSSADNNEISFEPQIADPVTLGRGEFEDFVLLSDVVVTGTEPISVAQYFPGQAGTGSIGDPSMVLGIPSEQFKSVYTFLTPSSFPDNHVNIISNLAGDVTLDGNLVENFIQIGDSRLRVARLRLPSSGVHTLQAQGNVGIVVYGFADFTSYAMPGGLDFRLINPPL